MAALAAEAPVPVVDIKDETVRLGGAANVANNMISLGAGCEVFCVIGDDTFGEELRRRMEGRGIDVKGLVLDPNRPTTVKTRVIAHNQQVVRTDRELRSEVSGQVETRLVGQTIAGARRCDAIVISDYGKGVITKRLSTQHPDKSPPDAVPPQMDENPAVLGAEGIGISIGASIAGLGTFVAKQHIIREKALHPYQADGSIVKGDINMLSLARLFSL